MVYFRDYIRENLLKPTDRILEFGPLNGPIAGKARFKNSSYADIRTTDEIKKLYTTNDYLKSTGIQINIDEIVDIDYVIKDSYKNTFKEVDKFDAIVLSHVIEHIPDIVNFFVDVSSILSPKGKLIIIYPDARYCFDHFRNGTSFMDAYGVFTDSKNTGNRVLDFAYNVVHENRPSFFWDGDKTASILPQNAFSDALKAHGESKNGQLPDDMHFWPFADYQFVKFLYDMDRAGLLAFDVDFFHPTQNSTQEFMIVLTPKSKKGISTNTYKKLLNDTHPVYKEARKQQKINRLKKDAEMFVAERGRLLEKVSSLENDVARLDEELKAIYSSKRWVYASRIASLKNRMVPTSRDENK